MELYGKEKLENSHKNGPARFEIPLRLFSAPENISLPAKIGYMGDTSKIDPADLKEAGEMIQRSADYIKRSAETPVEHKTAEILQEYINSGRVVLCDTDESGMPCYGFFCPHEKQEHSYIAVDINYALELGTAELVDTLFHEAYHAAQNKAGNVNSLIKEEVRAWNLGLEISNKYRREHDQSIVRTCPYTETELLNIYSNRNAGNGFTEIS